MFIWLFVSDEKPFKYSSYICHMFQKYMANRRYSFLKSTRIKYDDFADMYWEELET